MAQLASKGLSRIQPKLNSMLGPSVVMIIWSSIGWDIFLFVYFTIGMSVWHLLWEGDSGGSSNKSTIKVCMELDQWKLIYRT